MRVRKMLSHKLLAMFLTNHNHLLLCISWLTVFISSFSSVHGISQIGLRSEPSFISRSETFKFVAGETITLPCQVSDVENFIVAWKRSVAILSAGNVKVTPDPRIKLSSKTGGFTLQIRDAVPQDAGDYTCQIATLDPMEITHTVEILVPPRIHHISSGNHIQVKKGSQLRIECSASGNPSPNVTWSRKNNVLPNGDEVLHSSMLSITEMDRHKSGIYICSANNGVGKPAATAVQVHVQYPPEIALEAPIVYSGEGEEAMLVCIVHGEAQPEVIWFKDTMQIDTTERHIMENRGSRHTLIIRKVHPQDFGNYSCVAENQLGKSRKTLQLTGTPGAAVFVSPSVSQYKDRYNISWTVESFAPVEEYKLFFRRLPESQNELDNSIEHSQPLQQQQQQHHSIGGQQQHNGGSNMGLFSHSGHRGSGGGGGGGGGYNGLHWSRNDWRDVVLPAVPLSHLYMQSMSYVIRGLDPDQHYEARVQARNKYGWSNISDSFTFSTSSNEKETLLDLSSYSGSEMRGLSVTYFSVAPTLKLNQLHYILITLLLAFRHFFLVNVL